MYTKSTNSFSTLFKIFKIHFIWYGVYVTSIYVAYHFFKLEFLDIKMSIATVIGFAVALLLGFRTSASYDRWWEARKIWGAIVNDSRTLIRQLIGFTGGVNTTPEIKKMTHYQIAWCKALKNSLRNLDPLEDLDQHLTENEINLITGKNNKPNEILKLMEDTLHRLKVSGNIDSFQMVALDQTLKHLCDHMGKAERIKNTVFPTHYSSYTHKGIVIFTLMLPFGMLYSMGPFTILISLIVSFFFSMLEIIAYFLQDPFKNKGSDTPMSALTRTIEINLLELIEEENIPKPLLPDERGILM